MNLGIISSVVALVVRITLDVGSGKSNGVFVVLCFLDSSTRRNGSEMLHKRVTRRSVWHKNQQLSDFLPDSDWPRCVFFPNWDRSAAHGCSWMKFV